MTSRPITTLAVLALTASAACGNYSNEDLEFMNAVPAREDLSANMPRSMILPANEAELSRLTHDVVGAFNGALAFLDLGDTIRRHQPTGHIPDGRVWGPFPAERAGWQWRFRVTRTPATPDMFNYWFELEPVGGTEADWITVLDGWFYASNGVRRGVGHFRIQTDDLRNAGWTVDQNEKHEVLKELIIDYSTADFPISVKSNMVLYPGLLNAPDFTNTISIHYEYLQQESGQGEMRFSGTDSTTGWTLSIDSHWLATGRGRADATAENGTGAGLTRTQCWDDSFRESYDNTEWDPLNPDLNGGDPGSCPDVSTF